MRLIDADALREEVDFHPTSVSVCMTVEQARGETNFKLRCLEDIDNAPTIDAIPVEWLKEQIAEAPDSLWASLIKSVMNQWQKEQEAERRRGS